MRWVFKPFGMLLRRWPPFAAVFTALFAWRLFRRVRSQQNSAGSGAVPPPGDRPGPGMAPESMSTAGAPRQTAMQAVRSQALPAATDAARMTAKGVRWSASIGWRLGRMLPSLPGVSSLPGLGGGQQQDVVQPREREFPSIRFEWLVRATDPGAVRRALEDAGVEAAQQAPPSGTDDDAELLDNLQAAGIHLDQEAGRTSITPAQALFTGVAGPQALTNAVGRAVSVGHFGFVVDTSTPTVEIDEHQDVGRGTFILVEPGGSAQSMPSGTTRALLGALRAIEAGTAGGSGVAEHTADWPRPHHHETPA